MFNNECNLELGGEYKVYLGDDDKMEEVIDELYEVSDIKFLTHAIDVVMTNKNRKNFSITLSNPELTENSIISKYCVFMSNN